MIRWAWVKGVQPGTLLSTIGARTIQRALNDIRYRHMSHFSDYLQEGSAWWPCELCPWRLDNKRAWKPLYDGDELVAILAKEKL
jgi:hypothetical protein